MICFITDQAAASEADILSSCAQEMLTIRSLDGVDLHVQAAPALGWTHSKLTKVSCEIEGLTGGGADAFLGASWVGSTEV